MDLTIAEGNDFSKLLDRAEPAIKVAEVKLSKTYGFTVETDDGKYEIYELPGSNETSGYSVLDIFNESDGR